MSTPPSRASAPRIHRSLALIEIAAIALLISTGVFAWCTGIRSADYDYDEVQRAHSTWLASQGLRPYSGFFECHPPYFLLLTPIIRIAGDPCSTLLALRLFSALGNAAFLAGLAALAMTLLSEQGKRWAVAGVGLVAFHPDVLSFLVDFRIDGWGYALAVWAAVRFRRRESVGRFLEFGLTTGLASGLFCPKLVLLPPLIVAFASLSAAASAKDRWKRLAGYSLGLTAAVGLFVAYLLICGISLERTILLLARYHAQSNAHASYRYGLLQEVSKTPTLTVPILAGVAVWLASVVRHRGKTDPYPAALAVWLASQALLVSYPYRQYYAPWFLLGSAFVAVLGTAIESLWRPLGTAALLLACIFTADSALAHASDWSQAGVARLQCEVIRVLNQLAAPGDRVVAVPPYHPITRHDTFFVWFNTTDPNGYDSERIMGAIPGLRPLVSERRFRQELDAHPPAFAVVEADGDMASYVSGQWRALSPFLRDRGYRSVQVGRVRLAVRPDRFQRLRKKPPPAGTATAHPTSPSQR